MSWIILKKCIFWLGENFVANWDFYTSFWCSTQFWATKQKRASLWMTLLQQFVVPMPLCYAMITYSTWKCDFMRSTLQTNINSWCSSSISLFSCRDCQQIILKQLYLQLISQNVKMSEKWDWYAIWNIPWIYRGRVDL